MEEKHTLFKDYNRLCERIFSKAVHLARQKVETQLKNLDMNLFFFNKVLSFDSLQPVSANFDKDLIVTRSNFTFSLHHNYGVKWTPCEVEALLLKSAFENELDSLVLCYKEYPGRALIFPPFRKGNLQIRNLATLKTNHLIGFYPFDSSISPKDILLEDTNGSMICLSTNELDLSDQWRKNLDILFCRSHTSDLYNTSNEALSLNFGSCHDDILGKPFRGLHILNSRSSKSLDLNDEHIFKIERCNSMDSIESDSSDIFSLDTVPELQPFVISKPDSINLRYSVAETGESEKDVTASDDEIDDANESKSSHSLGTIEYQEPSMLINEVLPMNYAEISQSQMLPVQECLKFDETQKKEFDNIEIKDNWVSKFENDKFSMNLLNTSTKSFDQDIINSEVFSKNKNTNVTDNLEKNFYYLKEKKHTKGLIGAFRQLFKSKSQTQKMGQNYLPELSDEELTLENKKESFLDDKKTMVPLHFRQQFSSSIRNERCLSKILEEEFSGDCDDLEDSENTLPSATTKTNVSVVNISSDSNSNPEESLPNSGNQALMLRSSRSASDSTLYSYLPSISLPESQSQTTLQLPMEDEEVILKTLSIVSKWQDSKWQRFSASHMLIKVSVKKSNSIGFVECSLGALNFKFAITKNTSIRRGTAVDVEIGSVNCEPKCEALSRPSTLMFRFYNSFEAEEFALNTDASRRDITSKVLAASNDLKSNGIFINRSLNSSTSTLDKYISGAPSVITFTSTFVPPKLSKQA